VPQQQSSQATVVPAPLKGMNAAISVSLDSPEYCFWAINLIPSEYGMRVRSGYREWQIGLGSPVRTIINYPANEGPTTTTNGKIFAATSFGIYDVTVAGAAPTLELTFATASDLSGWGTHLHLVTQAGNDLVYYADEENGLFEYDPVTELWAQATGIQAIAGSLGTLNATDIVFIMSHKLRLWLITRGSNKAWYLPISAIKGDATEFFFSSKFKHGGELVGLYNWTVDGGLGRDDHLIAISREGDVIPWTGEDPSDAMTWTSTGVFYIGTIPKGRRIAAEYGGEIFMLSAFGLSTLSDLLRGGNPEDPFRDQIGYRIARLLRADIRDSADEYGWSISFAMAQGALVVNCPQRDDTTHRQYVYNLSTSGWGLWKDVPINCSETQDGRLMLGTRDGRILRMDVASDNVLLSDASRTAIQFFILTSYLSLGAPAQFKRVKFIRPTFIGVTRPNFEAYAFYDFLVTVPPGITGLETSGGDLWDVGLWDVAKWSAQQVVPFSRAVGSTGIGRSVSIAMSGTAYEDLYLASWDILWDTGGFL
jgi:hypothetical protein